MKESNAGSLMELLTNTMDWGEEALALVTVIGDSSSSAIMITHGAQRACSQADICFKSQSVRAASGLHSWRLLYSNRWPKGEGRSRCRGGSICPMNEGNDKLLINYSSAAGCVRTRSLLKSH